MMPTLLLLEHNGGKMKIINGKCLVDLRHIGIWHPNAYFTYLWRDLLPGSH